jgi:cobalamin biosynthesis protein CobW
MGKERIPATVITGFLGAGKTTLVKHIISHAKGKKFALIVNEFGDIGMDADMIGEFAADDCQLGDVIELANGCICCTVADDFLPSIQKILAQSPRPDHIIIETSGLALPQPLVQAFGWPDIRSQVRLDGVVTLVDGPALAAGGVVHDLVALTAQREADDELDHESPIEELFADQIAAANIIVVSKVDQLSDGQIDIVRIRIKNHLPAPTPIIEASQGYVPLDAVLGLDMEAEAQHRLKHSHHHTDDPGHEHLDHGHDEFTSFIIELPSVGSAELAEFSLAAVAEEFGILRAKGRIKVEGKALPLVVQAVGCRVDSYYARDANATIGRLVVIGLAGMDAVKVANRLGGQLVTMPASGQQVAANASS